MPNLNKRGAAPNRRASGMPAPSNAAPAPAAPRNRFGGANNGAGGGGGVPRSLGKQAATSDPRLQQGNGGARANGGGRMLQQPQQHPERGASVGRTEVRIAFYCSKLIGC